MYQIFQMQLHQILKGSKKWVVVLLLLAPVALTYVTMRFGGLGEMKRETERAERIAAGEAPEPVPMERGSRRRVVSTGETLEFHNGALRVTPEGVFWGDRKIGSSWKVRADGGYIVVEDGYLWIDDSKKPDEPGYSLSIQTHGPDLEGVSWKMVASIYLFLLYPQTICMLLALFYGSSLLNNELENKTLTYLFTRPIARWRVILGKYLAIVCALVPPTALSVAVSWTMMGTDSGVLLGTLVGAIGGTIAYNALFVLFGFLVPKRAMVLALIYGVLFEFFLSFVPAMVNEITITYYLRSLVVEILAIDVPPEISRIVGGATVATALLALAGTTAGALMLSSMLASRREYVVADQA